MLKKNRHLLNVATGLTMVILLSSPVASAQPGGYELPNDLAMPMAYHHHPLFRIVFYDPNVMDGPLPKIVGMRTPPANVGIGARNGRFTFKEVHTHESTSGTLHVESKDPTKKYLLGNFFAVWMQEDPRIQELIDQILAEGTVYLFDYNKSNQTWFTTRVPEGRDFRDLPLDDNRHIVVYLPGETTEEAPMVPSS
jgi:hypothetical protein